MEASAKTRVTPRDQRGVRWVRSRLVIRFGRTVGGTANDDTSMVAIRARQRQPPWAAGQKLDARARGPAGG
jgi:hypothetical protein